MLALPSLAGTPAVYQGIGRDAIAAQCALELARVRPLVEPKRGSHAIEHTALVESLRVWLEKQCKGLRVFDFNLRVASGVNADNPVTIFISNDPPEIWHQVWCLERRWNDLERAAPGLAGSALSAVCAAHVWSVPIFTPDIGLGYAMHYHWQGEEDETEILKEIASGNDPVGGIDMFRRADFDRAIPKHVTYPKALPRRELNRLARRKGTVGTIADLTRSMADAVREEYRRQRREKVDMTFSSDDDEGTALGYALAIRWNSKDPLAQLCDDHLEYMGQIGGTEALGWFDLHPTQIPAWIAQMERRFAIVRLIDRLVPLIATRQDRR